MRAPSILNFLIKNFGISKTKNKHRHNVEPVFFNFISILDPEVPKAYAYKKNMSLYFQIILISTLRIQENIKEKLLGYIDLWC